MKKSTLALKAALPFSTLRVMERGKPKDYVLVDLQILRLKASQSCVGKTNSKMTTNKSQTVSISSNMKSITNKQGHLQPGKQKIT